MTFLILGLALLALLIGAGARWLFRQRDPREIAAAPDKLKRFRGKR